MDELLPVFPLGTVLLPHMVLPLHVFEDRYRTMLRELRRPDGTFGGESFGVVLIERGHEVGGGDTRVDRGTTVRILDAEELDDGRWVLVCVGRRRFRVVRWLADDPYPRAEVTAWDDPAPGPDVAGLRAEAEDRLRRVLALAAEAGDPAAPGVELTREPVAASYQASALAPVGPLDSLRLLSADSPGARFRLLLELLDDHEQLLRFRLGGDADDDTGFHRDHDPE